MMGNDNNVLCLTSIHLLLQKTETPIMLFIESDPIQRLTSPTYPAKIANDGLCSEGILQSDTPPQRRCD